MDKVDLDAKKKFLNRSIPYSQPRMKHVANNIKNIKRLSDMNKLRSLQDDSQPKLKYTLDYGQNRQNSKSSANNANFVYFKRNDKSKSKRRFNEKNYNTSQKRPQTQIRHLSNNSVMSKHDYETSKRGESMSKRSIQHGKLEELTELDKFSQASKRQELSTSVRKYNDKLFKNEDIVGRNQDK